MGFNVDLPPRIPHPRDILGSDYGEDGNHGQGDEEDDDDS